MQDANDEIEIFLTILFMLIETLRHDENLATDLGRSISIAACCCQIHVIHAATLFRQPRSASDRVSIRRNITTKRKELEDISCEKGMFWK
jgi:hypothetical protein